MINGQPDSAVTPREDFPFYAGDPVALSATQWLLLMLSVAAAFAILIIPFTVFQGGLMHFFPAILFFAIPLWALIYITPHHWKALFRPLSFKSLLMVPGFVILAFIVSVAVGIIISNLYGANANAAITEMVALGAGQQFLFFLRTIPQLFGEELLGLLPFLALLSLFYSHYKLSRRTAIILALIGSCVIFGLVHLPAYNWNLVQCILVIGTARAMLTFAYLVTKNIWISTATHIIYDWSLFGLSILIVSQ